MDIPSNPSISYIATVLFLLGIFLFISGLSIIKVEKISVLVGFKTWFIGLVLMGIGGSISFINLNGLSYQETIKDHKKIERTDNSLILSLPFNGSANDESGNGHKIISSGVTLTSDRYGKKDRAYYFNGSDSVIKVTSSSFLDSLNSFFSISLWVKLELNNGTPGLTLIRKGIGCYASGWALDITKNNLVRSFAWGKPDNLGYKTLTTKKMEYKWSLTSRYEMQKNMWHFIVLTIDEEVKARLYIDGTLKSETSINSDLNINNNMPISIGANNAKCGYNHNFIKGIIDEIKIYSYALTQKEIKFLFKNARIKE